MTVISLIKGISWFEFFRFDAEACEMVIESIDLVVTDTGKCRNSKRFRAARFEKLFHTLVTNKSGRQLSRRTIFFCLKRDLFL